jgi:hypothetical protein
VLLPFYNLNYWIGARANGWPVFDWVDPQVPRASNETYEHWGTSGNFSEPNNLIPQENCAVANFSQMYDGVGGWADTRCSNSFIFMCKVQRELPLLAAGCLHACLCQPDSALRLFCHTVPKAYKL